jgi:hypothetical protein
VLNVIGEKEEQELDGINKTTGRTMQYYPILGPLARVREWYVVRVQEEIRKRKRVTRECDSAKARNIIMVGEASSQLHALNSIFYSISELRLVS